MTEKQAFDAMLLALDIYAVLDPGVAPTLRALKRYKSLPKGDRQRDGIWTVWTTCVDEAIKRSNRRTVTNR